MNKKRLRILRDFLRRHADELDIDMGCWADVIRGGRPLCGTPACAIGWATTLPSFKRDGLKLRNVPGEMVMPVYSDDRGWTAVERFFEVNAGAANYMFSPNSEDPDLYVGATAARACADRIDDVLEGRMA